METLRRIHQHQQQEDQDTDSREERRQALRRAQPSQAEVQQAADQLFAACVALIRRTLTESQTISQKGGRLVFRYEAPRSSPVPNVVIKAVKERFASDGWSVEHLFNDGRNLYEWLDLSSPTQWWKSVLPAEWQKQS
ncbi:MAG: hypothetical protein K2W82_15675 [Candidatus Obscuribacterales bacterium]|nr:hypothetical protein [Candidatus Obscuribacterales bacterium]